MTELVYNLSTIPPVFSKKLMLPVGAEIILKVTGEVTHNVSYTFTATLAKGAMLTVVDDIKTTANCKIRLFVVLEGEGASLNDKSRYYGYEGALLDIERVAVHTGVATESHLEARGVVGDSARAVWRGRIRVDGTARKALAFQKHDAILVGTGAHVDASPTLEIYTNDVVCNHSASIQRITPETLFYCMSRGATEYEARQQILEGFIK